MRTTVWMLLIAVLTGYERTSWALDAEGDEHPALQQVKTDLFALAGERAALQADFYSTAEQLIPLTNQATRLQQELQKSEQAIRQKTTLIAQLQASPRPGVYSSRVGANGQRILDGEVVTNNQNLITAINEISNEVLAMRTAMQPAQQELRRVQAEISQHNAHRAALETQLSSMYERWGIVLSPIHEHSSEKALYLREIYGRHAEVPEVGLWLACLCFYCGDTGEAARALDAVDRVVSSPASVCLLQSKWDFVYLSLMIDSSNAAKGRFARFFKAWPKHPQIGHLQAMVALRDGNYSVAKTKLVAAVKSKGSERNVLLNSDAAWFLAAAPKQSLRDDSLAAMCVDRVFEWQKDGSYNAFRARAALAAQSEDWEAAKKHLEGARTSAPKSLLEDIEKQFEAYEAEEQFLISQKANDPKAAPVGQ